MKKRSLDDLWEEKLREVSTYFDMPTDRYSKPLNELFQEARSREHRWRDGVIFSLIGSSLFGLLFYGVVIRGVERDQQTKDQEICVKSAEQQRFSPALCSDTCFRDSYLELQREWKIDDLDLASRIAYHKCMGNK